MRNMIFKTLFASILGSLFIAPLAHADRQGGGTLRAMNVKFDSTAFDILVPQKPAEWVRFEHLDGDKLTFSYSWYDGQRNGLSEVTLRRDQLKSESGDLIKALISSRADRSWQLLVE